MHKARSRKYEDELRLSFFPWSLEVQQGRRFCVLSFPCEIHVALAFRSVQAEHVLGMGEALDPTPSTNIKR